MPIAIIIGLAFGLVIMIKMRSVKLGYQPLDGIVNSALGKYFGWYCLSLVAGCLLNVLIPIYGRLTETFRLSIGNPVVSLLSVASGNAGLWLLWLSMRELRRFYGQFASEMSFRHWLLAAGFVGVGIISIAFMVFAVWLYQSNSRIWWFS